MTLQEEKTNLETRLKEIDREMNDDKAKVLTGLELAFNGSCFFIENTDDKLESIEKQELLDKTDWFGSAYVSLSDLLYAIEAGKITIVAENL